MAERVGYFVLLNYSQKSWSIFKTRDRFRICCSWRFQNTPYIYILTKFWLRYLRSKTHETIFKHDCLLQGQAQLDQRAVFCFCTLRFFSPSPSSFPSCWYWCYWWWTKPFLEQNVQMSVIFIPNKSIIINIIEWYHVSLTSNKIACFKVKLRWTRGSFFVFPP